MIKTKITPKTIEGLKLTADNYFSLEANRLYMSNSQFKGFLECEAMAMAKINGKWIDEVSDSMIQGKYVHAWSEGKLKDFKMKNPQLFKKDGTMYSKYEKCEEIVDFIKKDELLMKALDGKKEVIFTADMFGASWKILIDSYCPEERRFADLKVLKSLTDKFWDNSIQLYRNVFEHYGYFTQMAIYAEVERLANNRKEDDYLEPFIAVATKEKYPNKDIVSFVSENEKVEDFIRSQLLYVEAMMPRILSVKNGEVEPVGCNDCDYCKSIKKLNGTTHYTKYNLQ